MIANRTRSLLLPAALALSLGLAGTAEARKPRDPDMSGSLRHVTVNGASLAYLDVGKGEPVVLVHGTASDYRAWIADLAPLSTQCRVIAYSRRYHFPNKEGGEGSDYSLALHVRDLGGFIT